jgi:hypothetical protein
MFTDEGADLVGHPEQLFPDLNQNVIISVMQTEQIVALLIEERNRLDAAINALQGPTKRRGRPPGSRNATAPTQPTRVLVAPPKRKGTLSAAGRKAIADAARKRWAAIKAGKAPSPFASKKKARG